MTGRVARAGGIVTAAALVASALPFVANSYFVGVGFTLLTWVALTESWFVISGMTGYISLGHVVFVGIGAYVAAIMLVGVADLVHSAARRPGRWRVGHACRVPVPARARPVFRHSDVRAFPS